MAQAFARSSIASKLVQTPNGSWLSSRRPLQMRSLHHLRSASQLRMGANIARGDQQTNNSVPKSVTDALRICGNSVELAAGKLWDLDVNRLSANVDYTLDLQGRSRGVGHDAASHDFFSYMSPAVWEKPTFAAFWRLLDNYEAQTGVSENVTKEERAEEIGFIREICCTPIGQFLHRWLHEHVDAVDVSSVAEFAVLLHNIWFRLYRRDAERDSSAFEHVFCGEIDNGQVKGLHNFIQIYRQQRDGRFDYRGFLSARARSCDNNVKPNARHQLLTVRFEWMGYLKPASSMFVGTSPEFEIALYTLMYMSGKHDVTLDLGPYTARVRVLENSRKIGSAFPMLLSVDEYALR